MTSLIFTESAATKVYQLISEENDPDLCLRVFIQGGGCSGFQYGFTFDKQEDEDTVVTTTVADPLDASKTVAVKLLVDPMSYPYLSGAHIDYREDINGAQFVIRNNPNVKTTCGCGSSFVPNEDAEKARD